MKFSDFNMFIRPEVQGCPDFLIERSVRDSAIDFCSRTDVYMIEPESLIIIAGVNEYAVTLPTGTELNHIIDIYNDKKPLKPVSYTELEMRLGDETERGTPHYYSQRDNTDIYLAPIPDSAETFKVVYSLKPTATSTSIPDTIGRENREAITHGALYRLQMMSGQPFSNVGAAQMNNQLFEKSIGRAARQVKYGFAGGTLTCKPRLFI